METSQEATQTHPTSDFARTLLVLNNYEWLRAEAEAVGVEVIPIKGIDLLLTVYAEHLDRPVRDIDLLCRSEEDCRKLVARLCQEEYRPEFPFALQPDVLASKRKVSLLSCSTTKVNVDVHTAFVTKKFFSQTVGTFNADALDRCRSAHMDALDRWLFLAQHAAFHLFSDPKWIQDLGLIYVSFTPAQRESLATVAHTYGFRRVYLAALYHVRRCAPPDIPVEIPRQRLTASERRFLTFVCHFDRPFTRRAADRLIAAFWEFAFIAQRRDRLRAWWHLMFPSRGALSNIYRIRRPLACLFFYPLNVFVAGFTSALFWVAYVGVGCFGRRSWRAVYE